MDVERLVERLARITSVVAVTLGGLRARGQERADSDWDFGLYYRGHIDAGEVRALGFSGHVAEPGSWGRLVDGGAWLAIDGERVDLLYRDIDVVAHGTLTARGQWALNEKGLVGRAGLRTVGALLAGCGQSPLTSRPRWPGHERS